jgi:spoIIIJ-associated protein
MKDRLFSGRDLDTAVASAAQALGLGAGQLRYVVLERERPGSLGLSATPARIAVLLDAVGVDVVPRSAPTTPAREDGTVTLIAALARALGQPIEGVYQHERDRRTLRLTGPGCDALLDPEGKTLHALEHLLSRFGSGGPEDAGLRLVCAGYRELRDQWLCQHAQALGREVLADGIARESQPLNAYERRLIHMTVAEQPALRTFSQGQGNERRVTVALAEGLPEPE